MEVSKNNDDLSPALEILMRKLEEAKARNPHISLRAFSLKLGMSSGALSEILNGRRALSNAVKRRIVQKLLLSPQETLQFFQDDLPDRLGLPADDRMTLSQDQFQIISDWWYFGLLNLVKTRGFKNQISWMARRLGLSTTIVSEAWERLFRLGYLEKKGTRIFRKQTNVKTTDQLVDLSIRKSHIADLALIEKSLLNVPLPLRDNTSCTFVIDKKDLPRAQELVRIFQRQFLEQVGKDTGDEVYKMSLAIYPLTNVTGEPS